MRVSSTKSLWLTSALICALLGASASWARPFETEYRIRPSARLGGHLNSPRDLASHRYQLDLEQRITSEAWSFVGGVRGFAEGAYGSSNGSFSGAVIAKESEELALRDFYLQYKRPEMLVRVGTQQVVWGEAYGFYFADVVNPKDLREFGLGDLTDQRVPVPMALVKVIRSAFAIEGVFIPRAFFDISANPGSDFAYPYAALFPGATVTISEPRSAPWAISNSEFGLRLSGTLGKVDASAFFFSHLDRASNYTLAMTNPSPLELSLTAFHPRVQTFGLTASTELSSLILRFEGLYNSGRLFDVATGGGLQNLASDEVILVGGVEHTRDEFRVGLQVSERMRTEDLPGAVRAKNEELVTLHSGFSPYKDHSVEALVSYAPRDGSSLFEFKYLWPLSPQWEVSAHVDYLEGGSGSLFGRFREGSRAYLKLRGFFTG